MTNESGQKIEDTANQALERLTEIYVLDSLDLPSLDDLPETLKRWYNLSEQDIVKVVEYLNYNYASDMRDMGYLIRRENEFFPDDFSILFKTDALSVAEVLGDAKRYEGDILMYIGLSMEQGEWMTLKKPQSDSELGKLCNDLVREGIFQETPSGYRISEHTIEKIGKYCDITQ